ncbi:hypothetical protein RHMOL_Rhmol04G0242500 [Rhododendron molle]|uniref:Uncharacterized protein n=1 Tax=Rhododendron molle TaxID=49168 RepID=A0ACC0P544_RHOML|nr:hypothetical protein RHMOL_Rhmol04G0242500 [Rhododendron molle]
MDPNDWSLPNWGNRSPLSRSCLLFRIMSSSSSYYRDKNEAKKGVNNTPKLMYIPMECRCGMKAEIQIVKLKPLALEEEMRILFGSNKATGEGSYAPNSRVMPRTREQPPVVDVDNIDDLLDDDATQGLVHPAKVQKQVAVDGSATKKGKENKGTVTSRLEACMQQIWDSTDSASSPYIQRAAAEIPTMKECANKLSELCEFNEDAELWAQGFNHFKDSKIQAMFMSCPDDLRMYHFITQELNRARIAELAKTWFALAP